MAQRMTVWFDPEGDYLEFTVGPARKGFFKACPSAGGARRRRGPTHAGDDLFQRVDAKGNVIGFAIFNFRKRAELREGKVELPARLKPAPASA